VLIRSVPAFPHQLTQAIAVAAAETCEAIAHDAGFQLQVDLKWPNDVLIGGRKLAGILASAGSFSPGGTDGPDFVVVGLGLNIAWAPDAAISLFEALELDSARTGAGMRDIVLAGILERLKGLLEASAEVVYERYRTKLSTLGREVQAHLPTGEILEGRVLDVETDGRLVVLDSCAVTHRLDVGDIVHLR
jgi:BirA family biotin operon repressor/biotin-[acetyl-CoA-carboxylase] ligase